MARSRADLVSKALSILQEEGAGQTLAEEDLTIVDDAVDPLIAELAASDVIVIGNVDAIDEAVFMPLARMLANEAGEEFGRPYSEDYRLAQEMHISRVMALGPLYTRQKVEYF